MQKFLVLYMIIHVSFNRLSAPETKLLIYIYIYSIYQSEQRNSTSAIQFFWIRMDTFFTFFYMLLLAHPFRTSKFPGSRTSTLHALPVKR